MRSPPVREGWGNAGDSVIRTLSAELFELFYRNVSPPSQSGFCLARSTRTLLANAIESFGESISRFALTAGGTLTLSAISCAFDGIQFARSTRNTLQHCSKLVATIDCDSRPPPTTRARTPPRPLSDPAATRRRRHG